MGFSSPAKDYVERSLCQTVICRMGADSHVLETDIDFTVIEPVSTKRQGDVLLILCDGHTQFAKLIGRALLSDDGEAIDGSAL